MARKGLMTSNPDPSSSAARGAQDEDTTPQVSKPERNFFARFFGLSRTHNRGALHDRPPPAATGHDTHAPRFDMSNLRHKWVEDVAIPRIEIESVSEDITLDDLVAVFRKTGLTRLPVYEGTLDSPVGLVHLKDVALRFGLNGNGQGFALRDMLRPLLYVPPSMPIGVLLAKMQAERTHMALVIDEYGGVDGLVTIEDLIEQVIGDIEDEHDIAEALPWSVEGPGTYIALARAPLDEFEAEIGLTLVNEAEEEEVDTLGGLVFLLSGRVPARGEIVPHPCGIEFEVIDADPRRIKRLRVRLPKGARE